MPLDRRNQTSIGRKRRREFDRSVQKLRALGMPDWAVEYFRRAARVAGLPPHMIVCHVAVVAAGRQLQASIAQEQQVNVPAPSQGPADAPHPEAPSYTSVQTMRRRVTTLWREIERHGSLIEPAANEGAAATGPRLEGLSASKLTGKLAFLRAGVPDAAQAAAGPRRRKTSPKGH
jgi:hypothetical protein